MTPPCAIFGALDRSRSTLSDWAARSPATSAWAARERARRDALKGWRGLRLMRAKPTDAHSTHSTRRFSF